MRVVMLIPGHAPHFGYDWAHAAQTAGVEVIPVTVVRQLTLPRFDAAGPATGRQGHDYQVERVELRPSRFGWRASARLTAARVQPCLDQIAAEYGPIDLLHSHYYHATPFVTRLRRWGRFVHTEHSLALAGASLGPSAPFQMSRAGRGMARAAYQQAERVISLSRYVSDLIDQQFACATTVIPNPVDTSVFRPRGTPQAGRVVWVGRLSTDKQPDLMLRGFAEASARVPELRLEVVGDGPERGAVETLARTLGVSDRVEFLGRLSKQDVAQCLSRAETFVNTAQVETFGVAVAEALASGVPVVAPRIGAVVELVDSANGSIYEPGDHTALGSALERTMATSYDRAAISSVAAARFSTGAVGSSLIDLYRTCRVPQR